MRMISIRRLIGCTVAVCVSMIAAAPTQAALHLWTIAELYSNASGTLQFIELFTPNNGQTQINNASISVTNLAATLTNPYTITSGNLVGSTINRRLLFGTAGIQAAGGPAPDYIIPNGFLFTAGGTINTFGTQPLSDGAYTALPTDGTQSRIFGGNTNNPVNSPTNGSGQSGVVVGAIPEPTSIMLVSLSLAGLYSMSRRRRTR